MRAVYVAAGLLLAAFLVWRLADLLLLAFGASLVLVLALVGAAGWLLGAQVSAQVSTIAERLPASLDALKGWLREQGWLAPLMDELSARTAGMATHIGSLALTGIDVAVAILLVIFGGIYFGAEPGLYRDGVVQLFPQHDRGCVAQAPDLSAYAMRRWLLSQFVDMLVVVAMGYTFGPLGIFFAAPPAVVLYVLVRELYVR